MILTTQLDCGCTARHDTRTDNVDIVPARGKPSKFSPNGSMVCTQTRVLPLDRLGKLEASRLIRRNNDDY